MPNCGHAVIPIVCTTRMSVAINGCVAPVQDLEIGMNQSQIEELTGIFAVMSPIGWIIPHWLCDLRDSVGLPKMPYFYVIDWT